MKDALCKAFCADLHVETVPIGLAVSHRSWEFGGDPISIYLVGPDSRGFWRIQDNGGTVSYVEAAGADLGVEARADALREILASYDARYDEASGEIISKSIKEADLPKAALGFFLLLVRIQDLALLTRERVEAIWVQEAEARLRNALPIEVTLTKSGILSRGLQEYPADFVIQAVGRLPVALYFGTSDAKAYEALLLRALAKYHFALDAPVILMLETDKAISKKQRLRADNNLIVPRYRGAESDAIGRIVEEATGVRPEVGAMH